MRTCGMRVRVRAKKGMDVAYSSSTLDEADAGMGHYNYTFNAFTSDRIGSSQRHRHRGQIKDQICSLRLFKVVLNQSCVKR